MYDGLTVSLKLEGIADLLFETHDDRIARAEKNILEAAGWNQDVDLALDGLALTIHAAWSEIAKAAYLSGVAYGQALATGE